MNGVGWLAIGLVTGAVVAVLYLGGKAPAEEQAVATTVPLVTSTRPAGPTGLGEVIPGFSGGLMAVRRSDGRSLQLLIWPETGIAFNRSIPVGTSSPPTGVEFDHGGTALATVVAVSGEPGGVLYAGVPDAAAIVDSDVTGFAWDDTVPLELAYTRIGDGETELWVTRVNMADSRRVTGIVGVDGGVVAHGPWGYAIANGTSTLLVDPEGRTERVVSGQVLASGSAGFLAVASDSSLGLLDEPEDPVATLGPAGLDPTAAAFAADGIKLAVLAADGLKVLDTRDGSVIGGLDERPGVAELVWTPDSRFVLYPGLRGVFVLDTEGGMGQKILDSEIVVGLSMIVIGRT